MIKHVQRKRTPTAMERGATAIWLVVLTAFVGAGCSDLFEVDNPTNIEDEGLNDPRMLPAIANSPQGVFSIGYDNVLVHAGTVADEINFVTTYTLYLEFDLGVMDSPSHERDLLYRDMSVARWVADDVIVRLGELLPSPDSDRRMADAHYWSGLSRVVLADHFEEVPIDAGPPNTPAAMYEQSLPFFDRVVQIAGAAGDANLQAAAMGSKARALRSLYFERGMQGSDFAAALQAAEQALAAKSDYWLDLGYELPGSSNWAYERLNTGVIDHIMDPRYANMIDPVSGELDPRIQHTALVGVARNGREHYHQLKYSVFGSDIPVSRWQEARLVAAEAHLVAGNLSGAVGQINLVRADAGLPAFSSTDVDAIYDQLKYERRVEFWLEGRRWQDHRYYGSIPQEWELLQAAKGVSRRWPVSAEERDRNENYR